MTAPRSWIRWIDTTLIASEATPSECLLGYGSGIFGAVPEFEPWVLTWSSGP